MKKTSSSNSDGSAIVSPSKTIKTYDKQNGSQDSLLPPPPPPSSTIAASINNLLSTKKLEPVQVHSVISTVGQQSKQQSSVIQSVSVKTLLNNSPTSSSSNSKTSQLADEIRLVF